MLPFLSALVGVPVLYGAAERQVRVVAPPVGLKAPERRGGPEQPPTPLLPEQRDTPAPAPAQKLAEQAFQLDRIALDQHDRATAALMTVAPVDSPVAAAAAPANPAVSAAAAGATGAALTNVPYALPYFLPSSDPLMWWNPMQACPL